MSKAELCLFLPFVFSTGKVFSHSSSTICSVDQFECLSGTKCIPRLWLCDGARDCPDGSDERHSQCHSHLANISCLGDQPDCLHGGVLRCIPNNWLCDGHRDCDSGEDEANCDGTTKKSDGCSPSQFRCGKECIFYNQVCKEKPECNSGANKEAKECSQLSNSSNKKKVEPLPSEGTTIHIDHKEKEKAGEETSYNPEEPSTSWTKLLAHTTKTATVSTTASPSMTFSANNNFNLSKHFENSSLVPAASVMRTFNSSFSRRSKLHLDMLRKHTSEAAIMTNNLNLSSLAKIFRSGSGELANDIRMLEEPGNAYFKRDTGMMQTNAIGQGKLVYDNVEEKSERWNGKAIQETVNIVQGREESELEPVKPIVGEPIKPVNL